MNKSNTQISFWAGPKVNFRIEKTYLKNRCERSLYMKGKFNNFLKGELKTIQYAFSIFYIVSGSFFIVASLYTIRAAKPHNEAAERYINATDSYTKAANTYLEITKEYKEMIQKRKEDK